MRLAIVRDRYLNDTDAMNWAGLSASGHEVYLCGTHPIASVPGCRQFVYENPLAIITDLQPDLIDVPDAHYSFSQYFAARFSPVVMTAFDNIPGKNLSHESRQAQRQAARHIARTAMIMRTLLWDGVPADRITVIPPAVDVSRFFPPSPDSFRSRENAVLFPARITLEKGLQELIWALTGSDTGLWVAGDGDVGFFREWARICDVRVNWLGQVPHSQMPDLMRMVRVCCVPSFPLADADPGRAWTEQFGLWATESMACGTPVVTTDVGSMMEIVGAGKGSGGFCVPARDWVRLGRAIDRLASDEDLWQSCSEAGVERVTGMFSTEAITPLLEGVYRDAVSRKGQT